MLKRGRNTKFKKFLPFVFIVIGVLFLFLIWAIASWILKSQGNYALPNPIEVLSALFALLFTSSSLKTYLDIGWTLYRLFLSFIFAFIFGLIFGIIAGLFPLFERFFSPFVLLLKTIPTVAVVMLLTGLFTGISYRDFASYIPVILGWVIIFPLIYEAIKKGFQEVNKETKEALTLEGATYKILTVKDVYLPSAAPYMLLSFLQSLGLGLKVIIMAEVLAGSSVGYGLGIAIMVSRDLLEMDELLAYCLIAILLIAITDTLLYLARKALRERFPFLKKNRK